MELLEKAEESKNKAAYIERINKEKNELARECEELKDKLFASAQMDVAHAKQVCTTTNKTSMPSYHKKGDPDAEYV